MTKLQAEIIVALAENQTSITNAAKKLFMHRTTLYYHIKKIQEATGKNPMDFYDLCELLPEARYVFYGVPDQTRHALNEIGRKAHEKENNE